VILVTVDRMKVCENGDITNKLNSKKMTTKQQLIEQQAAIALQKSRIKKKTSARYVDLYERWSELNRRIEAI
jgi:hypothetical protein